MAHPSVRDGPLNVHRVIPFPGTVRSTSIDSSRTPGRSVKRLLGHPAPRDGPLNVYRLIPHPGTTHCPESNESPSQIRLQLLQIHNHPAGAVYINDPDLTEHGDVAAYCFA